MSSGVAVSVQDLVVSVAGTEVPVVDGLSFDVARGEVLAIVGESGSGKSTTALTLLGYARPGLEIAAGSIEVLGHNVSDATDRQLRALRGRVVAYVPQDAAVALNPSYRVSRLLDQVLCAHRPEMSAADRRDRVAAVLEEVELPSDKDFLRRYPHQLSGGQQQRLGIALAIAAQPGVVVFDEPTTGLDALTQRGILSVVRRICADGQTAAVFISHDLDAVRAVADRTMVLYSGRLAEVDSALAVSTSPRHPYSRSLLQAIPSTTERTLLRGIAGTAPPAPDRPSGCAFHPRCPSAQSVCVHDQPLPAPAGIGAVACHFPQSAPLVPRAVTSEAAREDHSGKGSLVARGVVVGYNKGNVLHGVDLTVAFGHCVGLLGGSGSGKTTLARAVVGLVPAGAGVIELDGQAMPTRVGHRDQWQRRSIQYVFQNPYGSLHPRRTIRQLLAQPARAFGRPFDEATACAWLERVSLSPKLLDRRPAALSGGERQRVAIARALAVEPRFLICDEITASLDVSVQASIVELLRDLVTDLGLGVLFVTHDLGVVRSFADDVVLIHEGHVVERATTTRFFDEPASDYAKALLANDGTANEPLLTTSPKGTP